MDIKAIDHSIPKVLTAHTPCHRFESRRSVQTDLGRGGCRGVRQQQCEYGAANQYESADMQEQPGQWSSSF